MKCPDCGERMYHIVDGLEDGKTVKIYKCAGCGKVISQ